MPVVGTIAGIIALLNLPFGFWRAGLRKLSFWWFVAIHAPIPLAVALRLASGLGWRWQTLPIFVGAYFAGQFGGGRLRMLCRRRGWGAWLS